MTPLRSATIRLAASNPSLRPHLLRVLSAASLKNVGDTVSVLILAKPGAPQHYEEAVIIELVHGLYTSHGKAPFVDGYRLQLPDGSQRVTYAQPAATWRDDVDNITEVVERALKKGGITGYKRYPSRQRRDRALEVAPSQSPVAYADVLDAVRHAPGIRKAPKGQGGVASFAMDFPASQTTMKTFYIYVWESHDHVNAGRITISTSESPTR